MELHQVVGLCHRQALGGVLRRERLQIAVREVSHVVGVQAQRARQVLVAWVPQVARDLQTSQVSALKSLSADHVML